MLGHRALNEVERALDKGYESRKRGLTRDTRATVDGVLDRRTLAILEKLKKHGSFKTLHGCISTGKEANVYSASGASPPVLTPQTNQNRHSTTDTPMASPRPSLESTLSKMETTNRHVDIDSTPIRNAQAGHDQTAQDQAAQDQAARDQAVPTPLSNAASSPLGVAASHSNFNDRAIKIFKTSILVFRNRRQYVEGDHRFSRGYVSVSNPRKMVKLWAEKEYRNLRRVAVSGIRAPVPLECRSNIIVMTLLGLDSQSVAPKLRDVLVHVAPAAIAPATGISESAEAEEECEWEIHWKRIYVECITIARVLYQKCKLIHGDLSEYNILLHMAHPYLIDVSQSMDTAHPKATQFLKRDCVNLHNFFSKMAAGQESPEGSRRSSLVGNDPSSIVATAGSSAFATARSSFVATARSSFVATAQPSVAAGSSVAELGGSLNEEIDVFYSLEGSEVDSEVDSDDVTEGEMTEVEQLEKKDLEERDRLMDFSGGLKKNLKIKKNLKKKIKKIDFFLKPENLFYLITNELDQTALPDSAPALTDPAGPAPAGSAVAGSAVAGSAVATDPIEDSEITALDWPCYDAQFRSYQARLFPGAFNESEFSHECVKVLNAILELLQNPQRAELPDSVDFFLQTAKPRSLYEISDLLEAEQHMDAAKRGAESKYAHLLADEPKRPIPVDPVTGLTRAQRAALLAAGKPLPGMESSDDSSDDSKEGGSDDGSDDALEGGSNDGQEVVSDAAHEESNSDDSERAMGGDVSTSDRPVKDGDAPDDSRRVDFEVETTDESDASVVGPKKFDGKIPEGVDPKEWKRKVKESNRLRRQNKIPKKVKKAAIKKGKRT